MEQEAVHLAKNVIKSALHKNKRPININEVDMKKEYYQTKNHTVKIHLSTLLDIDMKLMLFHLHYA